MNPAGFAFFGFSIIKRCIIHIFCLFEFRSKSVRNLVTHDGRRISEFLHEFEVEDHVVLANVVAVGEVAAGMVGAFVVHGDSLGDGGAEREEVVVSAAGRGASVEGQTLDVQVVAASVVDDELVLGVVELGKPEGVSRVSVRRGQLADLKINDNKAIASF